ncbi:MAG: ABC transporter permease [Limisphaerales bacterium]
MIGRILRIARRDYIAAVFTKGFLIGLVLAPLLMGGGLLAIPLMKHTEPAERRLVILDPSGTLAEPLTQAAAQRVGSGPGGSRKGPELKLEFLSPETNDAPDRQRLTLADRVRSGSVHAFVEVSPEVFQASSGSSRTSIQYFARSSVMDETRGWIEQTLNQELRRRRFDAAGIGADQRKALEAWFNVQGMTLPSRDQATGEVKAARRENELATVGVPMAAILAMMMLVMMGALPLLQSVLEEKSQRIAEVLLGCASPWEIMAGKLLGGVGVTLTAMVFYGGAGGLALGSLAVSGVVPLGVLPWFLVYGISAVLLYGSAAVALGSACSDAKDAQHLQMPVMMPLLIPVMVMMPILKEPHSTLATALSLFPPFTPLVMVLRLAAPGGVPAWQNWIGVVGVLVTTAFTLWIAGRIFRVGILLQGKAPKFSEILRWGLRG